MQLETLYYSEHTNTSGKHLFECAALLWGPFYNSTIIILRRTLNKTVKFTNAMFIPECNKYRT